MTGVSVLDYPSSARLGAPTELRDLTPGLLLFFARPSPLQTWAEAFGHEWRHVGVTIQTENGLMIASYGHNKCFRLDDPFEIMDAYDRVGVARVFSSEREVRDVEDFCRRFIHFDRSDAPYSFSSIFFGPIHLIARQMAPGPLRSFLMFVIYLYCLLQEFRYRDRGAYACSTFVVDAMVAAMDTPLRLPLSFHPDDHAAYATPSTKRDELFARWLCGPTELWQAVSPLSRAELNLENLYPSESDTTKVDTIKVESGWIEEVASSKTSTLTPAPV